MCPARTVPANAASGPETQTTTTIRNIISPRRVCSFEDRQLGRRPRRGDQCFEIVLEKSRKLRCTCCIYKQSREDSADGRDDVVAKREMIRDL